MNAFFPSLLVLVSLALTGCIDERDPADVNTDDTGTDGGSDTDGGGDTDGGDTDGGSSTPESDDAYTYASGVLEISRTFNLYPGEKIGFFCDGCGVEDGWTRAVTLPLQSEEGDLSVNLGAFGNGADLRWSLAVVNSDLEPTQWLWESGTAADQLEESDPLGLTIPVQECVGEVLVDKLDFCTQLTSSGIMAGSCWGTYVPPEDCTDADGDGDVDPGDGGSDGDGGSEDTDTVDNDGDGYSEADGDCDDGYPYSYPGAPEYYDGADQDCDGAVDDGCESDDSWNELCD